METTKFILRNIERSYEIYQALVNFEENIFGAVDQALRHNCQKWLPDQWTINDEYSLAEEWCLDIIREELKKDDEPNASYISIGLAVEGDDPIWKFFGVDADNRDSVYTYLTMVELPGSEYETIIPELDSLLKEPLFRLGFQRKGGKSEPYYKKELSFSNLAVYKGLEEDDWEEALRPVVKALMALDKLDWHRIISIFKK
ncbi:MAG: hypothetical protein FJ135_12955 [Deltaproteobacteria bacterium]|nr:hypothetical protein [Deltaproteobacteria bacterium]